MASDAPAAAVPSLSAAEALAAAPFCQSLSEVDLARLVPELEELHLEPGTAVYCQGDDADGLYLIRSGTAELTVRTEIGRQEVSLLESPSCFGDVELLAGEPRLADVVARTPLAVWRLPAERFEALVSERPALARQIAQALADRLVDQTRTLTDSQNQLGEAARVAYGSLGAAEQALLRRAALFESVDARLLRDLLGESWSAEAFERAGADPVFLRPTEREGWLTFSTRAVREFLLGQLQAEVGERGLREWRRRAAEVYPAREDADAEQALDLLHAAEAWPELAGLLERVGAEVGEREPEDVEGHLRVLPEELLCGRPGLVHLLADCCAAQGKLEQAVESYRQAQRRNRRLRRGAEAVRIQRALSDLYGRLGHAERQRECLLTAHHLETAAGTKGSELPGGLLSSGEEPPWAPRLVGRVVDACAETPLSWRWLGTLAVLAATGLAWTLPAPAGLSDGAFRVLVTMGALVALSLFEVLPDYVLGLLMVAGWVVTGTLPANVAVAGFVSPSWFLLLATMAVGVAVERSGLLYRGAIWLVGRLPPSHALRCLALAGLGFFSALAIPSAPGRVMLAMPVALDIADSLRQPARSNGAAALTLATFVGFGMFGTLFLTGNPMGLIVYGLFPPDVQARMGWGSWFVAALPAHLVLFGLALGFIVLRYRPEVRVTPPAEMIQLQQRVLGPLRRDEWVVSGVLILLVAGFSTQAFHGVNPAWVAVAAAALLFLAGALDDLAFKQGMNLSFLLYVGVILGFGDIFAHVQIDQWLASNVAGVAELARGSHTLFILTVAAITAILAVALRSGPVAILLALALYGPATSLGVNPWVVAFVVLLTMNLWVYPQQNMLYLTAYYAGGERGFSHEQARPLRLAYVGIVFVAIVASIPYWRWIGLLT